MVSQLPPTSASSTEITYPDRNGQPMADNTKQFRWIVTIQQNLEWWFAENPNVFVAGDLLWYPVEGNNKICTAPDVMLATGRPKGDRGSYRQWEEENIAPQVVFEILSPGNTRLEMEKKLLFYNRYGVEEYYLYDPDTYELEGWLRSTNGDLDAIEPMQNWVSPLLEIRFTQTDAELQLYYPNGDRFLTYTEIADRFEQERQRAERAEQKIRDAIPQLAAMGLNDEQIAAALGLTIEEVSNNKARLSEVD